jgi:hypothetical protein
MLTAPAVGISRQRRFDRRVSITMIVSVPRVSPAQLDHLANCNGRLGGI